MARVGPETVLANLALVGGVAAEAGQLGVGDRFTDEAGDPEGDSGDARVPESDRERCGRIVEADPDER